GAGQAWAGPGGRAVVGGFDEILDCRKNRLAGGGGRLNDGCVIGDVEDRASGQSEGVGAEDFVRSTRSDIGAPALGNVQSAQIDAQCKKSAGRAGGVGVDVDNVIADRGGEDDRRGGIGLVDINSIGAVVGIDGDGHVGRGAVDFDNAGDVLGVEGEALGSGISQAAEKGAGHGGGGDGRGRAEGIGGIAKGDAVHARVANESDGRNDVGK